MPREINLAGFELVKSYESMPGTNGDPAFVAYQCPSGVWTIGWGHTGPDVYPGKTITRTEAADLLHSDLDWAEACVEKATDGKATDNQFAALVSLCFNIGEAGFRGSTVLRLFKAGDVRGAANAFSMWRKASVNGKLVDMPGLIRRRNDEANLFLELEAPSEAPIQGMPQEVAPEKSAMTSKTAVSAGVTLAAGAANMAEQLDPTNLATTTAAISAMTDNTASILMTLQKVGPLVLSILIVAGAAFFLVRYVIKKRRGDVVST